MKNSKNQYVNCLIRFDYYTANYFALCVAREEDGKLICYRAKEKSVLKFSGEMIVEDSLGNNLGYVVDCRCKFRIPVGCVRKLVLHCDEGFVERVNQCYRSLEPLDSLINKYKELKNQYYHTPGSGAKSVRHQINELAQEITARKALFLQQKPVKKKVNNKYANFKQTPNKNGISQVYSGGSCSSK